MIQFIGNVDEVKTLHGIIPKSLYEELLRVCSVLDIVYGKDRNYLETGGYTVIVDNIDDMTELKRIVIDYESHPCESVAEVNNSEYISAVYVLNNDYSIGIYMPHSIAPKAILDECEKGIRINEKYYNHLNN